MLDLHSDRDVASLWSRMQQSWRALKPFREQRRAGIEAYVGSEWGSSTEDQRRVLCNFMALTAQTYMVALASNRPRVTVTSTRLENTPFAKQYQVGVNNLLERIKFERTLQRLVLDAFFSIGVCKIYWADSEPIEVPNPEFPNEPAAFAPEDEWRRYRDLQAEMRQTIWIDPGQPFVECVSLDDYLFDTNAGTMEKARFHGHLYRASMDAIRNDARFERTMVNELRPDTRWSNDTTFEGSEDKTKDLQGGGERSDEDIEDMCTLVDVWMPFEKKWCVFAPQVKKALYVGDWIGPKQGPFRHLCFDEVPENGMPLAPAANLIQLHKLMNSLMRKQARQAERQKDVTAYQGDPDDAKRVKDAKDGDMIPILNADSIVTLKYGGVDQITQAFYHVVEGLGSRYAGNLDAMGGLGPQSDTAKQDAMIHSAMSQKVSKMQGAVVSFVSDVVSDLGDMMWQDQQLAMEGVHNEPGISLPIQMDWTPDERVGAREHYQFTVDPFSMAYQSPAAKIQSLTQALQLLAPVVQMGGGTIDAQKTVEIYADLANLPELKQIVSFGGMPPMQPGQGQGSGGDNGGNPAMPTPPKEYIRRSVSGGSSPQGQRTQAMQASLAASGGQGGPQVQRV